MSIKALTWWLIACVLFAAAVYFSPYIVDMYVIQGQLVILR